jgi:hypothetical protein
MRRIAIAAFGVGVALAALAHCGGTTGRDSPESPVIGEIDATVVDPSADGEAGAPADASSDQSVYTNRFDVDIQYADQGLPDVQAPPEGGPVQTGPSVPDCPPFIYTDAKKNPLPAGTCDPSEGCFVTSAWDSVPADWSNAGEVVAQEGGACATYPWLGSLAIDDCVTSSVFGLTANTAPDGYNDLPPCNWAREAGAATQGPMIGASRYDLCMQLYTCFMQTGCFLYANPSGTGGFGINPIPCFCIKPSDLKGGFSVDTCLAEKGPCYNEEIAALEAPVDPTNPGATPGYVQNNFLATQGSGAAGVEGATLNQLFEFAVTCVPPCALDAGFDCGAP